MNRIRKYETMFIVKSTIQPEDIEKQINQVKENITSNGGTIEATDDMGSRQLAYEINKEKRGYYYVIYFEAPTSSILELERLNNINENILRTIFIKYESNKEIGHWQTMADATKKKKTQKEESTTDETTTDKTAVENSNDTTAKPTTDEPVDKSAQEPKSE